MPRLVHLALPPCRSSTDNPVQPSPLASLSLFICPHFSYSVTHIPSDFRASIARRSRPTQSTDAVYSSKHADDHGLRTGLRLSLRRLPCPWQFASSILTSNANITSPALTSSAHKPRRLTALLVPQYLTLTCIACLGPNRKIAKRGIPQHPRYTERSFYEASRPGICYNMPRGTTNPVTRMTL